MRILVSNPMQFRAVFCLVLTWFLVMTGVVLAEHPKANGNDQIAARVNGVPIYYSQLDPAVDRAMAKHSRHATRSNIDELRKKAVHEELDQLIGYELLVQAAKRSASKDVDQAIEARIKAAGATGQGHQHTTEEPGQEDGASRERIRREVLVEEYLTRRGVRSLTVPENDLKRFYEQNKASFKELESVKVSHILIGLAKQASPDEIAEARKEIIRIRDEIQRGRDFAELARTYSSCASSAAGGDLGFIGHGYMPQEFDKVAFSLKVGEVSDVVKTRHGFHLITVQERKPEKVKEFSEVRGFIETFLLKDLQRKKGQEIVAELRREAKIEIFLK